ncbi:MAG: holo-ACP synthase [Burkholderiaceae bacterium]
MIFGIGTDIQKVDRIREALGRHGERFVERILGPEELLIYRRRSARDFAHDGVRGVTFLATRFAAKEAISKALGLGMRMPMRWRAAQILKEASGKPRVATDAVLSAWMGERSLIAHVTLTDDADYAVAFAVVEKIER